MDRGTKGCDGLRGVPWDTDNHQHTYAEGAIFRSPGSPRCAAHPGSPFPIHPRSASGRFPTLQRQHSDTAFLRIDHDQRPGRQRRVVLTQRGEQHRPQVLGQYVLAADLKDTRPRRVG